MYILLLSLYPVLPSYPGLDTRATTAPLSEPSATAPLSDFLVDGRPRTGHGRRAKELSKELSKEPSKDNFHPGIFSEDQHARTPMSGVSSTPPLPHGRGSVLEESESMVPRVRMSSYPEPDFVNPGRGTDSSFILPAAITQATSLPSYSNGVTGIAVTNNDISSRKDNFSRPPPNTHAGPQTLSTGPQTLSTGPTIDQQLREQAQQHVLVMDLATKRHQTELKGMEEARHRLLASFDEEMAGVKARQAGVMKDMELDKTASVTRACALLSLEHERAIACVRVEAAHQAVTLTLTPTLRAL